MLEEKAGKLKRAKEDAIREQDYEKAAGLRDEEQKVLQEKDQKREGMA